VVFSEVKRRKRMSKGGMGARGRRPRYCSSKMGTSGGCTVVKINTTRSEFLL